MELLRETLSLEWEAVIRLAPRLAVALVVLVVLTLLGRGIAGAVSRILQRSQLPESHSGFFQAVTRGLFLLIGIVAALNIVGLKGVAASLLAGGGITAVVLGFAFRGIGENLLAGLFLMMGKTFKIGDVIGAGEFEGQVKEIAIRHTHIRAADGRDIFIPSIDIFSKPLVNFTKDGLRRLSFTLGIDYRDDIERARQILLQTVTDSGLVLSEPRPGTIIRELAASYVVLNVFYWIDTFEQRDGLTSIPTELMDRCRKAILTAGFTVSSETTTSLLIGGNSPVEVKVQAEANERTRPE